METEYLHRQISNRKRHIGAFIIFIAALILRLVYFYQVKVNFPGWDAPTIDPLYHDLWAKQIASGDLLGSGPFFRAPFYAYFLGLIYAILGASLAAAKIVQHVIGALTCSVIFIFADTYYGRKVAILSGLLAAANWVLIYHEDELLLDSLLVLFSVAIIWQLIRCAEKPTFRSFFIAGLWLGLASITRPNYLAIFPAIFIWLLLIMKMGWQRSLKSSVIACLGAAIFILPVTVRNVLHGKDTVLIASQGGINFYIGNNPRADGATAALPEFGSTWQYSDAEYLAKYEMMGPNYWKMNRELKPSEVSSFYYRKGLKYIVSRPIDWLSLMARKLDYFWNGYEISNNQNLYFYRRFASITRILPPLFYVISPLSILGLIFLMKYDRKQWIIPMFVIIYMLTVLAFFVNGRFRLPVLPFLIIMAAVAFWKFLEIIRESNFRKIAIYAAALVVLAAFTGIDFFGISNESFAMSHFSLGNIYLKKGMQDEALKEYATATTMAPCVPKAHLNRGIIYFLRRDFQSAEAEFNLENEKCGTTAEACNNLSVIKRLEGDPERALHYASLAIRAKANYPEAKLNEILAHRQLNQDSVALVKAEILSKAYPGFLSGRYFLGIMFRERGLADSARAELAAVTGAKAENVVERYDLSWIYAEQVGVGHSAERVIALANYEMGILSVQVNQIDSALGYFEKSVEILPDYAQGWINLALSYDYLKQYGNALEAFKKGIDLDPSNAVAYYNCGLTLGKIGRLEEAAGFFRQAIVLNPDFSEAKEKLRLTESVLDLSSQK
jgi:tetratricopeptide (TPR) repeat protein